MVQGWQIIRKLKSLQNPGICVLLCQKHLVGSCADAGAGDATTAGVTEILSTRHLEASLGFLSLNRESSKVAHLKLNEFHQYSENQHHRAVLLSQGLIH